MEIRLGTTEDIPALARMMSASEPWRFFRYSTEECAMRLSNPHGILYVVDRDGVPSAFAQVIVRGTFGGTWIDLLCVTEALRGTGIGSRMIYHITDILYPTDNIYLTVTAVNPRAKALYERLGFHQIGEITDYNFTGVSEYLMRLSRGPKRDQFRQDS